MKGIRSRISRRFDRGRPPSVGPIDFEIRALGGGDTSTLLLQELPPKHTPAPAERAAEILEEIRSLKQETAYYKALTNEALLHVVPMLRFHARGLYHAVEETCGRLGEAVPEGDHLHGL